MNLHYNDIIISDQVARRAAAVVLLLSTVVHCVSAATVNRGIQVQISVKGDCHAHFSVKRHYDL